MPYINPNTLDNGLAALKAAADRIFINSSEPATYAAASSGAKLGTKSLAAGAVFPAAIANGGTSGRKVTTVVVTDGTVDSSGTATHWSVCTSGSSRLEVAQALASSQSVTATNQFSLTAADVTVQGAT